MGQIDAAGNPVVGLAEVLEELVLIAWGLHQDADTYQEALGALDDLIVQLDAQVERETGESRLARRKWVMPSSPPPPPPPPPPAALVPDAQRL